MKSIIDLTDKRILIIGASSGIGKQCAITLSQVGAKVILAARREDKL
ncbi:MAG: SDR family NAD(P)-dependent oxidoreductase, partial [Ruminococcus sp.]|nr:SDR family NAD(P)-dependent oxidoreductase [Ruminococcus sp.]